MEEYPGYTVFNIVLAVVNMIHSGALGDKYCIVQIANKKL